jgi:hypothetical protein
VPCVREVPPPACARMGVSRIANAKKVVFMGARLYCG